MALLAAAVWMRRDALGWNVARWRGTIAALEAHVARPDCTHRRAGERALAELRHAAALASDDAAAWARFVERHPEDERAAAALARVDELDWQATSAREEWRAYLELHPQGAFAARARENERWRELAERRSLAELRTVLAEDPPPSFLAAARALEDELSFTAACAAADPRALATYLRREVSAERAAEAQRRFDEKSFAWAEAAQGEERARRYAAYLAAGGTRADEAREALERTRAAALASDTLAVWEAYLADCPGGPRAAEAAEIVAGHDLLALLGDGVCNARGFGHDASTARLSLDSLAEQAVTVRVEAGTRLCPTGGAAQDVIVREPARLRLRAHGEGELVVSVLATTMGRALPGPHDELAIRAPTTGSPDADLLRHAGASETELVQAALWIANDELCAANRERILLRANGSPPEVLAIGMDELARAFLLCGRAGVDLSSKRIWRDRFELSRHSGLSGDELFGNIASAPENLREACLWGNREQLEDALRTHGEEVDGALIDAVLEADRHEALRALVDAGRVERDDALLRALRDHDAAWVPLLLELGASPGAVDALGRNALQLAVLRGDVASVRALCDAGAEIEDGAAPRAFVQAVRFAPLDVVRELLARGARHSDPHTHVLHEAALHERVDVVRLLLEHGCAADARMPAERSTVLQRIAPLGTEHGAEIVALLLDAGADPAPEGLDPLAAAREAAADADAGGEYERAERLRAVVALLAAARARRGE